MVGQVDVPPTARRPEGLLVGDLTGHHQVGTLDLGVEIGVIGHDVEAADQLGADAPATPASPPAAGAVELGDVDAVVVAIDLDQALQAALEQPDLGPGRPFCGAKSRAASTNRVRTSPGDGEADAASRCTGCRATAHPGRRRWWQTRRRRRRCRGHPGRVRWRQSSPVPWVDAATASLPSAPPTNSSPEARGHLDDGTAAVRPPRGLDRVAERAMTTLLRFAPPRASSVPSPVGHRGHDHVVAGGAAARRGVRGLGRGRRASELVGRDHDPHGGEPTASPPSASPPRTSRRGSAVGALGWAHGPGRASHRPGVQPGSAVLSPRRRRAGRGEGGGGLVSVSAPDGRGRISW